MEEKGQVDIRLIPVLPRRDLRRICGELPDLLAAAREAQEGREDYIWAVLTGDPGLDPAQRLRAALPQSAPCGNGLSRGRDESGRGGVFVPAAVGGGAFRRLFSYSQRPFHEPLSAEAGGNFPVPAAGLILFLL